MSRSLICLGFTLLGACATAPGGSASSLPAATLLQARPISGIAFGPNGGSIALSIQNGSDTDLVDIGSQGEARGAETLTGASMTLYGILPDGSTLLGGDEGGNEATHIYVRAPAGALRDLTPGAQVTASFQGWSSDRSSFFIATNERQPNVFDVYEISARTLERRLFFEGGDYRLNRPGLGNYAAISRERRLIALEKTESNISSVVHLRDLASGRELILTSGWQNAESRPLTFSPDGRFLYFVSDYDSEFQRLHEYDVEREQSRVVLGFNDGDVQSLLFAPTGGVALVSVNRRGSTRPILFSVPAWRPLDISGLPEGRTTDLAFAADGTSAAAVISTPASPSEAYLIDTRTGGTRPLRSAWQDNGPPAAFVVPTIRRFRSADGLEISGILYAARMHRGPRRAVVWVHGGPNGQSDFSYTALFQYLAAQGYSVFAVNHRGSTGHGKSFVRLDDRRHATGDLQDIVEAGRVLVRDGLAEPGRVALGGGSFGGFLTLATITTYPHAFGAAINLFGIGNWERTLRQTPRSWASRRVALTTEIGDPDEDGGTYLRSISPLFRASRIAIPLFVMHGVNDPRVPLVESEEIVAAVRNGGLPVTFLPLAGEGHNWPVRPDNEIATLTGIAQFLDEHL